MSAPPSNGSQTGAAGGGRGGVLLLHGHGRTGFSMWPLASAFAKAGYATLSPSYGFRRPLPAIVEQLAPRVAAFTGHLDGPLHIVTHSLGGLVARALIARHRPAHLGRVVMLAPPLAGSELADFLTRHHLGSLLGPVGPWLRTGEQGARAIDGPVDFELGVVAGDSTPLPLPESLLPRPNDGIVSVAATCIPGMTAHVRVPVAHTLMPVDRRSVAQALAFIGGGSFAGGASQPGSQPASRAASRSS